MKTIHHNSLHKYFFILLFFIFNSTLFSQTTIYWDQSKILKKGKIGKISSVNNSNVAVFIYSDLTGYRNENKFFSIRMTYTRNGQDMEDTITLANSSFSNNEFGVDYDFHLTEDNTLYLIYRETPTRLILKTFKNLFNDSEIETSTLLELENPTILYLPKLLVESENVINIIYYSFNSQEKIHFLKIDGFGSTIMKSIIGEGLVSALNPIIKEHKGIYYLIYQAKSKGTDSQNIRYDIYLEVSVDKGVTWNRKIIEKSKENEGHNQKPDMVFYNNAIHITWEKDDSNFVSHIWYKKLSDDTLEQIFSYQVSDSDSEAHEPKFVEINKLLNITWLDNRKGLFTNYYTEIIEDTTGGIKEMPESPGSSVRLEPLIFQNKPIILWTADIKKETFFYFLKTDTSVRSPKINFKDLPSTLITNQDKVTVLWDMVNDISGIKEYKISASQDKDAPFPDDLPSIYYTNTKKTFKNLEEGKWYISLRAYDNAGNESKLEVVSFNVKTTPPQPPVFNYVERDENNFLLTNSPEISWRWEQEELYNYHYYTMLLPVDSDDEDIEKATGNVKIKNFKRGSSVQLDSLDNGILIVGTYAYDIANNRSDVNWGTFRLNKYVTQTYITKASLGFSLTQDKKFKIYGRGFGIDGNVNKIIIDRDKQEPYDYIIDKSKFAVKSDRYIVQHTPINIEDENYYIGVNHPIRGIAFSKTKISAKSTWLFSFDSDKSLIIRGVKTLKKEINAVRVLILTGIIIWILIIIKLIMQLINIVSEKKYFKKLLKEFDGIKEELLDFELNRKREEIMKIKLGLTIKYTVMILLLVFMIVVATSASMGFIALQSSKENLSNEINKRFSLISTNYKTIINDIIFFNKETTEAVDQSRSFLTLPNVGFVYYKSKSKGDFFAFGKEKKVFFQEKEKNLFDSLSDIDRQNHIFNKLYSPGFSAIRKSYIEENPPKTLLPDDFNNEILNNLKKDSDKKIIQTFYILNEETNTYNLKDEITKKEKNLLWNTIMKSKIFEKRIFISPSFDYTNLQSNYIYTAPLFAFETLASPTKTYVGEVSIGFSFEEFIKLLDDQRNRLVFLTLIVTAIAMLISIIGSLVLATSTVRPIKKIYNHVNVISNTSDYEKLVGTENEHITIETGDEIEVLAGAMNDMTTKLIAKAKADKQLLIGKEIQKKFIPLEPLTTDTLDLFGFYEGAAGVSGDYFDYKKLDDDHYAFIICDVAGKAVPAALIMVQISTIFHSYFTNFKVGKDKFETVTVVNSINDTVAERGFQGRFAAILVMILNVKTGKALLTNAGYTQLLVYRKSSGKAEFEKLNEKAGAAGVFPSFMLPHPYEQEQVHINKGDVVFLYSDGIEESRNGKTIITPEGDETPEEFGLERLRRVIEATEVKTPKGMITHIMEEEKKFRGDLDQYDDLTLLAVMRK